MFLKIARTVVSYLLFFLILLLFGPLILFFLLLPAKWRYDNKIYFFLTDLFYKLVLKASFLPITIIGLENISKNPSIIVANHQSSFDIPLIGSLLQRYPHIWLAKKELERSWVGPVVKRMAVSVDMSSALRGMRSLIKTLGLLNGKNRHVVIFPEGGRYVESNAVRRFFSGFALLAKKTGRPVVPVMIFNAYKVYPPGTYLIGYSPIKIIIGPQFFIKDEEKELDFSNRVRSWFENQVEKYD